MLDGVNSMSKSFKSKIYGVMFEVQQVVCLYVQGLWSEVRKRVNVEKKVYLYFYGFGREVQI